MILNMKLNKITKNFIKHSNIVPILYSNMFYTHLKTLEHIYPKSYINNIKHNSDIHNIFTTSYDMNALRSNYKYAEFNNNKKNIINICGNLICNEEKLFCPIDNDKGIIARVLLYMNDMYGYNDFGNYTLYKEWNNKFKPDIKELYHNEFGYLYQGVRNKYIDMHYKNDINYSYKSNMIKEDIILKLNILKNEPKNYIEWEETINKMFLDENIENKNENEERILNPKTGRYVLKSGKIGKELLINQVKSN
jgi:hypothetical protein